MDEKRKRRSEMAKKESGSMVRFPRSALSDKRFRDLWRDTTGVSADNFLVARKQMVRSLNKPMAAHLSYRIGMADVLKAAEKELGQDGTEALLRALARENEKGAKEPEVRYVDDEDDEAGDEWEDRGPPGDDFSDAFRKFMDFRLSRRKRRDWRDDRDPMFG